MRAGAIGWHAPIGLRSCVYRVDLRQRKCRWVVASPGQCGQSPDGAAFGRGEVAAVTAGQQFQNNTAVISINEASTDIATVERIAE